MGKTYTMTLKPDWDETIQLSDRTSLLRIEFDAPFDRGGAFYKVKRGDEIDVALTVTAPQGVIGDLQYHQLNCVCWPAPGAENQFFTTAFRRDPDQPDSTVLWTGSTRFSPFSKAKKKGKSYEKTAEMTFPEGLFLVRPGRFSFMLSVTLRNDQAGAEPRFRTFVTDPEMDVGGGGGGPPTPLRRLPREK